MTYPKTFDFKSAEDYLNDIGNAIKNNLPPSFIQTILLQYINAFYGDNVDTTSIFKLVSETDRLFGFSQDEINMKLAKGTIAKWEDILHGSILLFINDAKNANPNFLEVPIDEQKKILTDMAKVKEKEIQSNPVNDLLNDITV